MKKRLFILVVMLCVGVIEFQYFTNLNISNITKFRERQQQRLQQHHQQQQIPNTKNCGKKYWVDELSKEPSELDLIMDSEYDPNDGHKKAQINGVENIFVTLENGDFVQRKLRMSMILRAVGLSPRFVPKVNHGRAPLLVALDYVIKHDTTALILQDIADISLNFTSTINEYTKNNNNPKREILWLTTCQTKKKNPRKPTECGYGFIVNKNGAIKMKDEFVYCRSRYPGKTAVSYPDGVDYVNNMVNVVSPLISEYGYTSFTGSVTKYLYNSFWMYGKRSDLLMLNV